MVVAGLMSGTSVDAIEVAFVDIRGRGLHSKVSFRAHASVPYPSKVRSRIIQLASGAPTTAQEISQLNFLIGELFASAFLKACERTRIRAASVKLIGSHGQTVHHQPNNESVCGIPVRSTLQLGEPAVISARSGKIGRAHV